VAAYVTRAKAETAVTAVGGAAIGVSIGDFTAEFFSRIAKQTGWAKFGVKAAVKLAIAWILWFFSTKLAPGAWKLFTEVAAYGSAGSMALDFWAAVVPGGTAGSAASLAYSMSKAGVARGAAGAAAAFGGAPQATVTPSQTSGGRFR
jgi:hypothetical protein